MCLAIPGKVEKIQENEITVSYGDEKRTAELSLVDLAVGDYVIVNNKIIVQKLPEQEAKKFLGLIIEK